MKHQHFGQSPDVQLFTGSLIFLALWTEPKIFLPKIFLAQKLIQTIFNCQLWNLLIAVGLNFHQWLVKDLQTLGQPRDINVLVCWKDKYGINLSRIYIWERLLPSGFNGLFRLSGFISCSFFDVADVSRKTTEKTFSKGLFPTFRESILLLEIDSDLSKSLLSMLSSVKDWLSIKSILSGLSVRGSISQPNADSFKKRDKWGFIANRKLCQLSFLWIWTMIGKLQ